MTDPRRSWTRRRALLGLATASLGVLAGPRRAFAQAIAEERDCGFTRNVTGDFGVVTGRSGIVTAEVWRV